MRALSHRQRTHEARRAMRHARTWEGWREAAEAFDALTGLDAWRADDASPCYRADVLLRQIDWMAELRARGDVMALVDFLHESLYRHLGDLADPSLYRTAAGGTKHLVRRFLDEAVRTLDWLADTPFPGVPAELKIREFERAATNYGRTALMLSGGATLGFVHLGVVAALLEADLLPPIISGASTGAMIAAGICARNDHEVRDLVANPQQMRLDGLTRVAVRDAWRSRALLDPARLYEVLRHNIGDWTFAEAHARSGRSLNISVSPTRVRQKPRLLTHLTSPQVLVASAALASSSLPGLFPPAVLQARARDGALRAYVPTERWIDGSVHGDLPKRRLSRLHNANHFVVSQTNPHVLPFAHSHGAGGFLPALAAVTTAAARSQGAHAADLARRLGTRGRLARAADRAWSLLSQDYSGDIDIHPALHPRQLVRIVANPTPADLDWFLLEGQRATWPRLEEIRAQTRISRTFAGCIARLRAGISPGRPTHRAAFPRHPPQKEGTQRAVPGRGPWGRSPTD